MNLITSLLACYVLASVLLLSNGCARQAEDEVLARIDNKYIITVDDFNDRISKLPKRYRDAISKNHKAFLDEIIVDYLLYDEALNEQLDEDPDVQKVFAEAKKKILIARLLKDKVEDKVAVTEEDIKAYYEKNKDKFTLPETLRASHILVKNEDEAKDVLVQLSNGENFEKLAQEYSVDPTSSLGGDIGYFTRHQLIPEIEDVCFQMEVGEISGIIKTQFGYHIVKLTERIEPRVKDLSEVREAIEQNIRRVKKRMLFTGFVEELKEKYKITVNKEELESISANTEVESADESETITSE